MAASPMLGQLARGAPLQSEFARIDAAETRREIFSLVFRRHRGRRQQPLRRAAPLLCNIADEARPGLTAWQHNAAPAVDAGREPLRESD